MGKSGFPGIPGLSELIGKGGLANFGSVGDMFNPSSPARNAYKRFRLDDSQITMTDRKVDGVRREKMWYGPYKIRGKDVSLPQS
jgi:hypothetical protein